MSKFHDDKTIILSSREKCPASGGNVFQQTRSIVKLFQDIDRENVLTKFHKDLTINVTLTVLTMKNSPPMSDMLLMVKNASSPGVKDNTGTLLLTKFHED
ncbi:hypothetical protein DPMN_032454 [Dreissena polymorpha]|uniref:Uncharacterized protein n=1 Tax=Dreissena polymorpha TaxID=45954 RepID=A0A9D4M6L4_DREPO|nr:hypothetical protein DPMN_032454 [Dreissena polymorpha]